MKNIVSTIIIAIGVALSAFAVDSLEETGGDVTTTAQLAFKDVALADVGTTYTLCGRLHGAWVNEANHGVEGTFFNRQETQEGGVLTKVSYQFQAIDEENVKAVTVEFTAGEGGVYVKCADGNYTNYRDSLGAFGNEPITENAGTSSYVLYALRLVEPANAISVNFTNGNNLDTSSSVRYGAGAYAVPYSSWVNMRVGNNSSMAVGGSTVTISGTRGDWSAGDLRAAKDVRHGYIDESGDTPTPTVTVTDIPYAFYRVVVYTSTDNGDTQFGYVTINGVDYTGVTDATVTGSSNWGSTGPYNKAKGLREGVNYLVSPVIVGSTATVVGHRVNGGRGCLAAVQIVEAEPPTYTSTIGISGTVNFSDLAWNETLPASLDAAKLVVNVNEDATLNIDSSVNALGVEFNVAFGKTLTLTGSTLTASAIGVNGEGQVGTENGTQLAGAIFGDGTLVYYTASPAGISFIDSAWTGTFWCRNSLDELETRPKDQSLRSLADFAVPSALNDGETCFVNLSETREEYGKGLFMVTDVPAIAKVRVTRFADGTVEELTPVEGVATLTGDVHIDGIATIYDATFTNTTEFAYKNSSAAYVGRDGALEPYYNNNDNDATTGIYLRHHPYVENARSDINGLGDFTVVVVGQMSPTHRCQFLHIGSSNYDYTGLLIATTDKGDEVIIAPNTGKTVDTVNAVKVAVPNAATARHAYVVNKVGRTFTVWVDGIRRGTFTVADGWTVGSYYHAGVQVGSDFGGAIKDDTSEDKFAAVADSLDETGVINLMRIYDYVISDAQAEAIVKAYPYVSQGGLYTRSVSADADFSDAGAWEKSGDSGRYSLPTGATVDGVHYNPSATIDASAHATVTVNADVALENLTVGGSASLTFAADRSHTLAVVGAAIINSPITNQYGAVYLAGAPMQLGSSGEICFDCSRVDISDIFSTTHFQLTGLVDRDDAKMSFLPPPAVPFRSVSFGYNPIGSCYEFVVTPDHEAGSDVFYKCGAFCADSSDLVVVLADGSTQTRLFPGDNVVFTDAVAGEDAVVYFGDTLPADVSFSFADWSGVVLPLSPGSMCIWTGEADDGKMNTDGNWNGGVKPSAGAAVFFPARAQTIDNDIDGFAPASITFGYGSGEVTIVGNAITGVSAVTNLAYVSTIRVPVHFAGPIAVAQNARDAETLSAEHVVFAGGAYAADGCTIADPDDGFSSAMFGSYFFANSGDSDEAWVAVSYIPRPALADDSALYVPKAGETKELYIGSNSVFTVAKSEMTASVDNSPRFSYSSDGEVVASGEFTVGGTGSRYDGYAAYVNGASASPVYKIEKATCARTDSWTFWFGVERAASRGTYYFGSGGINFGTGPGFFGIGRNYDGDAQTIRPWYGDFALETGAGNNVYSHDMYFLRDVIFNTDDEDGVGRVITLNARPRFDASPTFTVSGSGKVLVNSVASNNVEPPVTVTDTATLAFALGASLTTSNIAVNAGAALEVAESGTFALGAGLSLANGACLGFHYTNRAEPVLDLTGSDVTFAAGGTPNVAVRISAENDARARYSAGGNRLTAGGKFAGATVSLAPGAPDWVKGVSVVDGDIVLEVKLLGTRITLR